VTGGCGNLAAASGTMSTDTFCDTGGFFQTVSGGLRNKASGTAASVTGGSSNTASAIVASVSGGSSNAAAERGAAVSGGNSNTAAGGYASITGGCGNTAAVGGAPSTNAYCQSDGFFQSITGGLGNLSAGRATSISGGSANTAAGQVSSIGGARAQTAIADYEVRGDGTPGYEIVSATTTIRDSGLEMSKSVSCPAGKRAVGGGFASSSKWVLSNGTSSTPAPEPAHVSEESVTENGFSARGKFDHAPNDYDIHILEVHAVCVRQIAP
jgi:hypothetical protein